jgi:hypothetical protein
LVAEAVYTEARAKINRSPLQYGEAAHRILALLRKGPVTVDQLAKVTPRYKSRIEVLRQIGHRITMAKEHGRAVYSLHTDAVNSANR